MGRTLRSEKINSWDHKAERTVLPWLRHRAVDQHKDGLNQRARLQLVSLNWSWGPFGTLLIPLELGNQRKKLLWEKQRTWNQLPHHRLVSPRLVSSGVMAAHRYFGRTTRKNLCIGWLVLLQLCSSSKVSRCYLHQWLFPDHHDREHQEVLSSPFFF